MISSEITTYMVAKKMITYFILYRATAIQMMITERGMNATVRNMTGAAIWDCSTNIYIKINTYCILCTPSGPSSVTWSVGSGVMSSIDEFRTAKSHWLNQYITTIITLLFIQNT